MANLLVQAVGVGSPAVAVAYALDLCRAEPPRLILPPAERRRVDEALRGLVV